MPHAYVHHRKASPAPAILDVHDTSGHYKLRIEHLDIDDRYKALKNEVPQPHQHHIHHWVYFKEGHNRYTHRGQIVDTSPGTLILSSPGEWHDFFPQLKGSVCYCELSFSLQHQEQELPLNWNIQALLQHWLGLSTAQTLNWPTVLHIAPEHQHRMEHFYSRLLDQLLQSQDLSPAKVQHLIFEQAMWIVELANPIEPSSSHLGVEKVRAHLEKHYRQHIDLVQLCDISQLSKSQLLKRYKQKYKTTPIEYQLRLRLEASKTLLRTTPMKAKDCAQELGFSHEHAFSKFFKQRTQLSPIQYRKLHLMA